MEKEDKVITPEQSEELVMLGVIPYAQHFWIRYKDNKTKESSWKLIEKSVTETPPFLEGCTVFQLFSAPDSIELGELLPHHVTWKDEDGTWCCELDNKYTEEVFKGKTEVQVRYTVFLWLIKEDKLK
jgi:hypothetical protein